MIDPDLDRPAPAASSVPAALAGPTWHERIDLLARGPHLTPGRVAAGVAAAAVLASTAWFLVRTPAGPPTETLLPMAGEVEPAAASTSTSAPATVLVHAAGAVVSPGVYELPGGARVTDLIDAAGGPTAEADLDQLNLAAPVVDGERVYVPRVGEVIVAASSASASSPDAGPLDINTATVEQLDALPGIGPATAQAIVDERERRGGFRSVDDLLDVRGIGPAKLEQLRDLVRV